MRGPEGAELRRGLDEYTRLRLDDTRAGPDPQGEAALKAGTNAAQGRIWALAQVATLRDPNPVMAGLVTSLNETVDAALAQRIAHESRVPAQIHWLLLAGSLLSVGAIGVQLGLGPRQYMVLGVVLMAMWTGGMLLIIDLNRPRQGNIQADPAPLVWPPQRFASGTPTTAPPKP